MTNERKLLLLQKKKLELTKKCRERFATFVKYMFPQYYWDSKYHDEMFQHVQDMAERYDVSRRITEEFRINPNRQQHDKLEVDNPRYLFQCPPRHSKTTMLSHALPAWLLGRYPDLDIISLSAGDRLSKSNSKKLQEILSSDKYVDLFGERIRSESVRTHLFLDRRNIDYFDVIEYGGSYVRGTVEGNVMGYGANLILIDDPIKDMLTAFSKTRQTKLWEWFVDTISSRVQIPYMIVVMHQRWATDDLAGRIIQNEGDDWQVIKYPAIQEDGTALCEYLMPIAELKRKKRTATNFEAMYQQSPVMRGGDVIKTDNIKVIDRREFDNYFFVCDTALKKGGDYSVISVWATEYLGSGYHYYLVDVWRKKVEYSELKDRLKVMVSSYDPYGVYIEDVGSGSVLIGELLKEGVPALELRPKGSKYYRVSLVTPKIQAGCLSLLKGSWNHDFLLECEQFRADESHPHDDQVDCMTYALSLTTQMPTDEYVDMIDSLEVIDV